MNEEEQKAEDRRLHVKAIMDQMAESNRRVYEAEAADRKAAESDPEPEGEPDP